MFLHNFYAALLRAVGELCGTSGISGSLCGIERVLDLCGLFLWIFLGCERAAAATVMSQYVSGVRVAMYAWKARHTRIQRKYLCPRRQVLKELAQFLFDFSVSLLMMNLGITMVQSW